MIQLPRPMSEEDRKIFELAKDKGKIFPFNTYGMPSGHMQYCMFSLVFISYTLQSPWISLFYLIISVITMYHRVEYKYHTILQVIVGSIIGILVGYVTYLYSKRYITGEINKKEDDNAYFSN
jgi:membrane-associated phospholipid phosphatase